MRLFLFPRTVKWVSTDGSLRVKSHQSVSYEQLTELLGGHAEKGAVVEFVRAK